MMRTMRQNTKWIMLATALAFVALMVFEWGADMSGRGMGGVGEIGSVNGEAVMYEPYQNTYRSLSDRLRQSQSEPITSQQVKDLEDAAFDDMVNRILIQQELERRGIRAADEEIRQAARFRPPPEIQQMFMGPDGFDMQFYQDYLASPSADPQILRYIEEYFRDMIPRSKLLRQVSSGLFLTDQELWRRYREQNETVTVRFIPLDPANRIDDAEVQVTDAEVREYYEENEEEFEVPARALVRAIVLGRAPTAADTAAALTEAEEIAEELRETGDWDAIAAGESIDPSSASNGGELGVLTPGQMPPAVDSVLFEAATGRVLDPVRSPLGFHVLDIQERWGRDSVQARQVLLPIRRTADSEIELFAMADTLEALGENMPLEAAGEMIGLEVIEAQVTEDLPFIQGAGQIGEGVDWIFNEASIGDVSPVFENRQAFYSLEAVQTSEATIQTLEEATPTIRQILMAEKKMELAVERGSALVERIRGGAGMLQVATDEGLQLRTPEPFRRVDFVPGLGQRNAAVGTAFGLSEGEVSDVVRTPGNAFILEKLGSTPADSMAWEAQKASQRLTLTAQLEQQRLQEWIEALRENAEIVDRRQQVLRPLDEDAAPPSPFGGLGG